MNLFPAAITIDGVITRPVKIVQAGSVLSVYGMIGKTPGLLFTVEAVNVIARGSRNWDVTGTRDGQTFTAYVEKDRGCGCSHPLKRYSPPRPVSA